MRQVFSQNKIGKYEIKTDDYSDVTFNLSYQIPSHKSVSIYIKAENLLDEVEMLYKNYERDLMFIK